MTPLSIGGQALRLWNTLRYLKPVQIYGRIWRNVYTPRADLQPAPALCPHNLKAWKHPATRHASLLDGNRFSFLGQTHALHDIGWDNPNIDKLWRYNLHYFDDLNAKGAEARRDWHVRLIVDWIQNNPPGKGTGWEPYPTSLRIVNWIKWALAGNELPDEALQSLAVQTRWLSKRLEWHLLGNHLLANAKALVFAGLFDGSEAVSWQRTGLSIYRREIPEQVLADGGHFERSPMYHAIILEDLLDLYNLSTAAGADHSPDYGLLAPAIERMRCWLSVMTHRDGGPGFFNDCAFGIAPGREDLEQYATRLGLHAGPDKGSKVHPLLPSGYVRVNSADLSAILDVAPIGPDYLPGHAHADTLSFEISLGEDRVIVNGGTSVYGTSAQRQFERSTAAHSTVEVDGENSSEVWGGFRVARRARVIGPEINTSGAAIDISAEHDGYKRLGGNAAHRRVWRFESGKFVVEDKIGGRFKSAIARFHMGPMAHLTINEGGLSGEISLPLGRKMIWSTSEPAHIESSTWHPEFGKSVETKTLVVAIPTGLLETTFIW